MSKQKDFKDRSTCIKCGKKRYRKLMKKSGKKDKHSGLDRWICEKCPFQDLTTKHK